MRLVASRVGQTHAYSPEHIDSIFRDGDLDQNERIDLNGARTPFKPGARTARLNAVRVRPQSCC